ncbi:type IV secretory system conjugative DNA transfer family protein [Rhizobium sp. BK376]|uniref:type IV secretory system conjugative DNA transfer family protein n=1 Tax=Rhizobium sp. BK376 TaxID=2512149 RepID=UPI001048AD8E|nr:type IV secretory system conjugative DNA transfer family protein [Rhizobium sp. BK376]TCR80819.1 type IV secretion system protein VirD4 [Rhizobium sp. BK376]
MKRSALALHLLFSLLTATATWMLIYSLILQFVWKDGRVLHLMTSSDPFVPFRQLVRYSAARPLQLAALTALAPALAVGAAVVAFGMHRPSNPLGDAAFQDPASLRRGGWFRKSGHVFGRSGRHLLCRNDDRHHLVIGPTRSGKGVGYVIPNALVFPGSMIVTDLKGEIFKLTAGYRKANGHEVFLFSPGSPKTHRWNALDFVRADRGSRTIDIQNIAAILIPESAGSDNAIWQGIAQQVIAGVISYVLESVHYDDRRTLGDVNAFFNSGVDLQDLMRRIEEREPDLSRFTRDSFNAYIALNERAARSALLDIQKALSPFRNERVVAATSTTDMDLTSLQHRPITIYLAPTITDMTMLRPLLTLFVQQVMDLLTRKHDPSALPVYFLLDEFRQLKKMDEVLNKLPYVAGYNIKIAFIIQNLKNLDEIYGETARHSLLGNCGLQIILGANDQATADYASKALGKKTIRYQSDTKTVELFGRSRRTKVEQIRERDLLMPQEIRQMPLDRLIILVEGERPIYGSKLRYYADKPFRSTADKARRLRVAVPNVDLPIASLTSAIADRDHSDGGARPGNVRDELADPPGAHGRTPPRVASAIQTGSRNAHSGFDDPTRPAVSDPLADRLKATEAVLRSAISETLAEMAPVPSEARKTIGNILVHTVPD